MLQPLNCYKNIFKGPFSGALNSRKSKFESFSLIMFLRQVTRVLKDLDLEKIMTAQAKNLSGGQKRKLSVGIAILGDPKVSG